MTFTYKLSRRLALGHLGLTAFAAGVIAACSGGEPTAPTTSGTTDLLAAVRIAPKKATIETNQAIRFSGTGFNAAGDSMATSIEWTATGGSITADGVFSASTTGSFRVIGKGRGHTKSDTSTVVVVSPQPTLASIVVTPDPATAIEGKTVSFSATGKLSDGSTTAIGVVWSATGGTIDAGGIYTAGMTPGTFHSVATNTSSTVADTVPITIAAPQLAQIVLLPATVTLAPGVTKQFTAYGRTATGDSITTSVSFTATGGTVSGGGLYTAGQTTGTFRVIAASTTTNLADTSAVTIQPATFAQLILVPALATVAPGGTVQFKVYGRTTAGDSVAAQATYSATGGTISSAGLYTAGSTAGTFQVIAKQTNGTLADTSAVTIAPSATCSSTATMLCPGDSLQAKVNAQGSGVTFTLQPGIYRMQTITPKSGQSFVGQPGAVMSGAKLLTGWVQSGGTWYVAGQTQKFADNVGVCDAAHPGCQYQEDVYRDNVLLTRVLSLSSVTTGTFFFDYTAQRIYVGDDPTGHTIEGAATEYAFQGNAQGAGTGVTLQGLIIEKYAAADGAVGHTGFGDSWVLQNNEIRYNHGAGIQFGRTGVQILTNFIHHNGELGIGVSGGGSGFVMNAVINGNEISYNNTAGFDPSWEAGGVKLFHAATAVTMSGNFVHHNNGVGLWADGLCDQITYTGNQITGNLFGGILHEISYSATITNNTITGNGLSDPSVTEGDGIEIASSGGSGIDISGNTLSGNKNGIMLTQADRGAGFITQNVSVHDNTVSIGPSSYIGADRYSGDTGLWTTNNNHFTHNTYNLQTAHAAPFIWTNDALLTDAQWKAAGNDVTGTFNR